MSKWVDLEKQLLSDPAVKKEYNRLQPRYALIAQLIEERIKNGVSQKELADRIGTKQSAIARFESGNVNPSLKFLQKIALAMGRNLVVQIK